MEKALAILEKYCQWIALGVGVLFLGVVVFSYVLSDPATVKVGGTTATPDKVNDLVAKSPAVDKLKESLDPNKPSILKFPPIPAATASFDKLKEIVKVTPIPKSVVKPIGDPPETTNSPPVAKSLPKVPKPTFLAYIARRGQFQWAKPVPPATNPAAVPAPAAAVDAVPFERRDIDYWSGLFVVKASDLTAAFDAVGLRAKNPREYATQFVGVELIRQMKDPISGAWGAEKSIAVLPSYQGLLKDPPPATADAATKLQFFDWAKANVATILQPQFPQYVSGEAWYEPGQPDPSQPVDAPLDQGVPGVVPPPAGIAPPPIVQPGAVPPPIVQPGGVAPAFDANGQPIAAGAIPGTENLEDGTFRPDVWASTGTAAAPAQVKILAHDITAEPGKTYRYKLRYMIRNPLFAHPDLPTAKALVDPPVLVSAESDWTPEAVFLPRVEFWVRDAKPRTEPAAGSAAKADPGSVVMDMFVEVGGVWQPVSAIFQPGDHVATTVGTTSYNSGWCVVDVRAEPKPPGSDPRTPAKAYVLIADGRGKMARRDPDKDKVDPNLLKRQGAPDPALNPGIAPPIAPPGAPLPIVPPPVRPPATPRPGGAGPAA